MQLLSARLTVCVDEECSLVECPVQRTDAPVASPAAVIIEPRRDILESAVQFMTLKVRFSRTVDEAEKMVREEKHSTSHNPLWIPMREVTIVPKFDW